MPAALDAKVAFTRDGYVLGDDMVNPLQANFSPTADGYTVGDAIFGGVGTTGLEPSQERTARAVDSLFLSRTGDAVDSPSAFSVRVTINADSSLALQPESIQVTLMRGSEQPDFFAQPPSPTPTASS